MTLPGGMAATLRGIAFGVRRKLSALRRGRRGGIAMIMALSALPMFAVVGLTVDLSSTLMAKARSDLAADSAAFAAAKTTANAFANGAADYISQGTTTGLAWFNAQAGTTSGLNMGTPVINVSQNGGIFTATLQYSGAMRTNIASFFGVPTYQVQGQSSATITVGGYADINVLMDVSSSMGIAATPAGISQLGPLAAAYNSSKAQGTSTCAFGCHWDPNGNDFYGLARRNGIQLRVDVMISAVQNVITQLISQDVQSLYRAGLYTFDNALYTIYPVSSNLNAALTAAQNVTVPVCCGGNDNEGLEPDTNYPAAMSAVTTALGASGSGATAATPRKFLFVVTDGVSDYYNCSGTNCTGNRTISTMTPSYCAGLKTNGITVLVLYTNYTPLVNTFYQNNVEPMVDSGQVPNNLQSCASSPNYFFQATDPTDIQAAMLKMLQIATATEARLIQ